MASLAHPRIEVHGHRGARAVLPENSLPAFKYAIDAGVDVLELDMAVTSDDVVVISHDADMNPAFCRGPEGSPREIRRMTLEQLRQWDCGAVQNPQFPKQKPIPGTRVPTLDEVFTLARDAKVRFNIETKISQEKPDLAPAPSDFARLVFELVRKHALEDRVILQSFDFRTLAEMKKLSSRIQLSALFPTSVAEAGQDYVAVAQRAGASIVSPHFRTVTPDKVGKAHAAGLTVVPWTANTPAEWDPLIEAKVDAIITDDPAALIVHLKRKGLR